VGKRWDNYQSISARDERYREDMEDASNLLLQAMHRELEAMGVRRG